MNALHEMKNGLTRLGIVILGIFFIVFITIPLKIYHFTLFNSGVSIVVGILALLWFFYSVSSWVTAGFRRRSLKKS